MNTRNNKNTFKINLLYRNIQKKSSFEHYYMSYFMVKFILYRV